MATRHLSTSTGDADHQLSISVSSSSSSSPNRRRRIGARAEPDWVAWTDHADGDADRAPSPTADNATRCTLCCQQGVPSLPDAPLVLLYSSVVLNTGILAAAIWVYALTSSQIVLAQAADSFLDVGANLVIAYAARVARRPADRDHLYGHQRAEPIGALIVAVITCVVAIQVLASAIQSLAAQSYPVYLKRATPQNIVIAGIAGAMPPLLGWTAVTNELHSNAWLLVMIIFIWTPPHFWALAIHRRDEYAKVNIPMLPVTHGIEYTKTSILLYTLLLSIVCILPVLVGMSSWIYLSASLVLNGGFVYHAWVLKYRDEPNMAMKTFKFSIYHLMILFVALLADHYLL